SVKSRAKIPASKFLNFTNTPTPANFVDSLLAERARELCAEGHRRWDLIRLGRYQQAMAKVGITVDNNHLLFPIPYTELQSNPNLTQNPGW
ncbi:RagB/SusD family nutrient uptake outer membrane protein, partial [Acinetobacter baumannii]